jgi:formylglycine-generating enzyme required for sulfatase activity
MNGFFCLILICRLWGDPPPGTIRIQDLYVDKTELHNIHWKEFLYYQKQSLDSVEYQKLLPDTANFLFQKSEFDYYPLVMISLEQAEAYCEWRSGIVNEKFGTNLTYRLMTEEEYIQIAKFLIKNQRHLSERELAATYEMAAAEDAVYPVQAIRQPQNRIYHFFDNVSEMTSTPGVAMGSNNGNLCHLRKNLERRIYYQKPHSYLGFRCVVDVNADWPENIKLKKH